MSIIRNDAITAKEELMLKAYLGRKNVVVAAHHDADGIYATALLSNVMKVSEVYFPSTFGSYKFDIDTATEVNGSTPKNKIKRAEVMVDMSPIDNDYDGLVLDHHPPTVEYARVRSTTKVIFRNYPATRIVYEIFKDKIPDTETWKVVAGLVGDGQPEQVPDELWDKNKVLLKEWTSVSEPKWGNDLSVFNMPLYLSLSSPVNALAKSGFPLDAYRIVVETKSPFDLLLNAKLRDAKEKVKKAEKDVLATCRDQALDLGPAVLWRIDTPFNVIGSMASRLFNGSRKTAIVVNVKTMSLSIRGPLARWIANKMNSKGWMINGHPGFVGGKLLEGKTFDDFRRDLIELI